MARGEDSGRQRVGNPSGTIDASAGAGTRNPNTPIATGPQPTYNDLNPSHQSGGGGGEHQSGSEFGGLLAMFEQMFSSILEGLNQPVSASDTDKVNNNGLLKTIHTRNNVGDEDVLQGLLTNNNPPPAPPSQGLVDEVVDPSTGKKYKNAKAARAAGVSNHVKGYLYNAPQEAVAA